MALKLSHWMRVGLILTVLAMLVIADDKFIKSKDKKDFVERVHIIFMNHLDVGYAAFAGEIINRYFVTFYNQAIQVANDLKSKGFVETFIYTTHPWLVSLYLDCPPNLLLNKELVKCPNSTEIAAFEAAVKAGYITWHAGPMNLQSEMAEEWLYAAGLDISAQLDKRFNITRSMRVLSQRDVPGMTEAVLPILVRKGISAVSVGVNECTPPPSVPKIFIWEKDGNRVLATWHPGGYPNNPGPDPSKPGGLSRKDCAVMEGFPDALCFAFRTDNTGPPVDYKEVLADYEILRAEFPQATLRASKFEDYFTELDKVRDRLPVWKGEMGDTWLEGVASDPRKCQVYRTVSRVLRGCIQSKQCDQADARILNATRFLIKLPEHTWGLDSEHDTINWSNEQFQPLRTKSQNFIRMEESWLEQRHFLTLTLEALQDHPVVSNIQSELKKLNAVKPDLTDYIKVTDHSKVFQCANANIKSLRFGEDGSIVALNYNGVDWASDEFGLGSFQYRTYDEKDFTDFGKIYDYSWFSPGYVKTNVTINAHPESRYWDYRVTGLYASKESGACDFQLSIEPVEQKCTSYYGAPKVLWLRYVVKPPSNAHHKPYLGSVSSHVHQNSALGIDMTLQLFDKTITRLPESLSLSFKITPQKSSRWSMSKINSSVDPLNVTLNGSQYQHAVDDNGVLLLSDAGSLRLRSYDVPLACPIVTGDKPHIFPAPLSPITKPLDGFAFNIYNNIWNTNWIFWYPYHDGDADFKARFSIEIGN